jgi:hypothetical protein
MDRDEARAHLGLDAGATAADVRRAFRALVRRHHPDVTGGDGATTRRLTEAYRTLLLVPDDDGPPPSAPARPPTTTTDDTLTLELPPDEAFLALLDAAAALGTVTAVDPESHVLEVLVTFDDGRTADLLVSLQGRAATGTTDAFCTLEPLDPRTPAPPVHVVVDALADLLAGRST